MCNLQFEGQNYKRKSFIVPVSEEKFLSSSGCVFTPIEICQKKNVDCEKLSQDDFSFKCQKFFQFS